MLSFIIFFEDFVHIFGVKFKVATDSVNPSLVHLIKTSFDDVSDFEIEDGDIFIEIHFNDVRDENEWELHFFSFSIFLEMRSDINCIWNVLIEWLVSDSPFHFLQSGP